jgi:hypothetical protein
MYVQEFREKKAERLHVRICPELKKLFEEKVGIINQFLREGDQQDLSSWVNRFITQFVANCDQFGKKMEAKGVSQETLVKEFAHILSLEQLLLVYDNFYQYSANNPTENELIDVLHSLEGDKEKLHEFWAMVERIKRGKEKE